MRIAISGYRIPLRAIGLVTALVLLAGACSPPATPAATPTEATPTMAATATVAEEDTSWDYVALGDSTVVGSSYVDYYATHIETDLGVEVTLHNWGRLGLRSYELLNDLRNKPKLRSDISKAEAVTIVIGANDVAPALEKYIDGETCGGADNQDCIREALTRFRESYEAVIAEILSLTSTSDTLILTMDYFYPLVNEHKELGVYEDTKPHWEALNEHIVQVASEHNISVARVYLAFNGPNGDEDPSDKGYIAPDGVHITDAGHRFVADLHRELGYGPWSP